MSSAHDHHHLQTTPEAHDPVDSWHDHSHDTEKPKAPPYAEVANAPKIILTGVALWLVIAISVVVVYAYYTHDTTRRLGEVERAGSSGPAMEALTYKRQAILNHYSGGTVYSQVVKGETVTFEPVNQLPIFDPAKPEVINTVKKTYGIK